MNAKRVQEEFKKGNKGNKPQLVPPPEKPQKRKKKKKKKKKKNGKGGALRKRKQTGLGKEWCEGPPGK